MITRTRTAVKRLAGVLAFAAGAAMTCAADAGDGFLKVGFEQLAAFNFEAPSTGVVAPESKPAVSGNDQIPATVKELDAKNVAVTGFMLPVKMDGGLVTEFLLVKDPMMCCYGVMPKVNEWIIVKMTGKGVQPLMDIPLTFYGKLRVGEMFENGYLTGIYLLEGERMGEVKG